MLSCPRPLAWALLVRPFGAQSKRSADLFFKVCGYLLSIGGKLALARFLLIIQNSSDQFTVHSLQFTVRIKNALAANCRLSTVNLYCQSSVAKTELALRARSEVFFQR